MSAMSISNSDALNFFDLVRRYPTEEAAVHYFEEKRWPAGARCPHCGGADVTRGRSGLAGMPLRSRSRLGAPRVRKRPIWHCRGCGKQFSVTTGTIMEGTKLPLQKWLIAFHLVGASKKGVSSMQLKRMIGGSYRTAWHLAHRIRATMKDDSQFFTGTIETDEVYLGGRRKHHGRGYRGNKVAVQTIVERNQQHGRYERKGRAQTIVLDPDAERVDGRTVGAKLRVHTDPERTILNTDESPIYDAVGESFKKHDTVNHKKGECARIDPASGRLITTNTAEGLFANLKRQIHGTHHSTSKKHLPKYLEEYDFKYNTRDKSDTERSEAAIGNIEGKRLTLFPAKTVRAESLIAGEPAHEGRKRGPQRKPKKGVGK